jgi:peptidoglycan hydrolase CwlO-like protein
MTQTDLRVEFLQEFGVWPPLYRYEGSGHSTVEDYVEWLENLILKHRNQVSLVGQEFKGLKDDMESLITEKLELEGEVDELKAKITDNQAKYIDL